ncbi:hypothetical protein AWB70_05769 [Caballeronia cordobensis]|uniref:Uncharacterized protein n=1 Tax=Caballeronia cordobensis TaxID=1353886 RepID=A0A158J3X1_CABCO|nr:hypothetical protein AWB70_05769 [Caballeronia cordobensis]
MAVHQHQFHVDLDVVVVRCLDLRVIEHVDRRVIDLLFVGLGFDQSLHRLQLVVDHMGFDFVEHVVEREFDVHVGLLAIHGDKLAVVERQHRWKPREQLVDGAEFPVRFGVDRLQFVVDRAFHDQ